MRFKEFVLSDSDLYKKIIGKYQKLERKSFGFPIMVFNKNTARVISQKINLGVLLRLVFYNGNLFSSFTVKSRQDPKRLFSRLRTATVISKSNVCIRFLTTAQRMYGRIDSYQKETASRLHSVLSAPFRRSSGLYNVFPVLSQVGNTSLTSKTYQMVSRLTMGLRNSLILMRGALISDKGYVPTGRGNGWEEENIVRPFIKPHHRNLGLGVAFSITPQRRTTLDQNTQEFFFHKQRKIEEEVEALKKIMLQKKSVVMEKSISSSPSKKADIDLGIDRISDQVYQEIERRIVIERERKGL